MSTTFTAHDDMGRALDIWVPGMCMCCQQDEAAWALAWKTDLTDADREILAAAAWSECGVCEGTGVSPFAHPGDANLTVDFHNAHTTALCSLLGLDEFGSADPRDLEARIMAASAVPDAVRSAAYDAQDAASRCPLVQALAAGGARVISSRIDEATVAGALGRLADLVRRTIDGDGAMISWG